MNEDLKDLWDYNKRTNMGVPEGKEKKSGGKKSPKRNNGWKPLKFCKRHKAIKKPTESPNRFNSKKSIQWDIRVKLLKTKFIEKKNQKQQGRNNVLTIGETSLNGSGLCIGSSGGWRKRHSTSQVLNEKNCQFRIPFLTKLSSSKRKGKSRHQTKEN